MITKVCRVTALAFGASLFLAGCGANPDGPATTITFQEAKALVASDIQDMDEFGGRVAIDGDSVAVGAGSEAGAGTHRGAVYLFSRNQGGTDAWGEVKKITASDAQPQDQFGWPVVILGDTIVIGAPCEDGQAGIGDNPGAAYIYSRNLGGVNAWGEVRKLSNSAGEGAFFGVSADISGDFLVIGALYNGGTGLNRDFGAVYFFSRNEGGANNWGLLNSTTASDGEDFDFLGMSASFSGNYAVVGAPNKDGGGPDRGAAYVFKKSVR